MNLVKTNIKGFDNLLGGGLPEKSITLLAGMPGTGKTIFALEYLYRGAVFGESGLYISFEENPKNLKAQAKLFGWEFDEFEKKGLVKIIYLPSKDISNTTIEDIVKQVNSKGIKRVIIDSVSTLSLAIPTIHNEIKEITPYVIKRFIHNFIEKLREIEATTLLITQTTNEKSLSGDSISEFMSDGIVLFLYETLGGAFSRSLIVRKMRKIKNNEDIHPLEISKNGIVIHALE